MNEDHHLSFFFFFFWLDLERCDEMMILMMIATLLCAGAAASKPACPRSPGVTPTRAAQELFSSRRFGAAVACLELAAREQPSAKTLSNLATGYVQVRMHAE
jgi:hypothetical protein